jgi:hypothetical protein
MAACRELRLCVAPAGRSDPAPEDDHEQLRADMASRRAAWQETPRAFWPGRAGPERSVVLDRGEQDVQAGGGVGPAAAPHQRARHGRRARVPPLPGQPREPLKYLTRAGGVLSEPPPQLDRAVPGERREHARGRVGRPRERYSGRQVPTVGDGEQPVADVRVDDLGGGDAVAVTADTMPAVTAPAAPPRPLARLPPRGPRWHGAEHQRPITPPGNWRTLTKLRGGTPCRPHTYPPGVTRLPVGSRVAAAPWGP